MKTESAEGFVFYSIYSHNTESAVSNIKKYKNVFDDILKELNTDSFSKDSDSVYLSYNSISYQYMLNDFNVEVFEDSVCYMYITIMYRDSYDMKAVRDGVERYCFELDTSIPEYRVDMFVSGDLRESMKAFSFINCLYVGYSGEKEKNKGIN